MGLAMTAAALPVASRKSASNVFMTPKRLEGLRAIYRYIEMYGFSPTRRAFAAIIGVSPAVAQERVDDLAEGGWIESNSTARGIRITDKGKAALVEHRPTCCPHCSKPL